MAGLYDYKVAEKLVGAPVDALIMAAVLQADSANLQRLERGFPHLVKEVKERYNAPGGKLEGER